MMKKRVNEDNIVSKSIILILAKYIDRHSGFRLAS
jgi:hypothetical protein